MRAFYTLPDPKEAGLKWREYERARAKVARIDERLQKTQNERARLEQEIRGLGDAEIEELKRAVLEGTDDPTARHGEHEKLVADLRELRRQEQAISQARPVAEEELRQVVYENQHRWKEEADSALAKAIGEERKAYARAQELISGPRHKRLYLEALAKWVRYPQPTFGADGDVAIPSAIQPLTASAERAEEQMQERRQAEQLQQEQAEEGAA